jgi:hypothetical protein
MNFNGAAMDLGLSAPSDQDSEAEKIRKKKLLLQQQMRQNGPMTPYTGAFTSLMNSNGNIF